MSEGTIKDLSSLQEDGAEGIEMGIRGSMPHGNVYMRTPMPLLMHKGMFLIG
jgi:hypothetical protein